MSNKPHRRRGKAAPPSLRRELLARAEWADPDATAHVTPIGTCPTGKERFVGVEHADRALAAARARRALIGGRGPVECRHYPCPACDGRHLTSQLRPRTAAERAADRAWHDQPPTEARP